MLLLQEVCAGECENWAVHIASFQLLLQPACDLTAALSTACVNTESSSLFPTTGGADH